MIAEPGANCLLFTLTLTGWGGTQLPSKPPTAVGGLTTSFPPKDKEDFPESQTTLLNNLDQSQLISLWPCFYIWSALYLKVALLNGDVRERA